jgi:hypothetical protein
MKMILRIKPRQTGREEIQACTAAAINAFWTDIITIYNLPTSDMM